MKHSWKIGDRVTSRAVGCVPRFDGEIVHRFRTGGAGTAYHVRNDADGQVWHRAGNEIWPQGQSDPAQNRRRISHGAAA